MQEEREARRVFLVLVSCQHVDASTHVQQSPIKIYRCGKVGRLLADHNTTIIFNREGRHSSANNNFDILKLMKEICDPGRLDLVSINDTRALQ